MTQGPKRTVRLYKETKVQRLIYPGADLVTEYDRAVENMISSSLKDKYPHYECV